MSTTVEFSEKAGIGVSNRNGVKDGKSPLPRALGG